MRAWQIVDTFSMAGLRLVELPEPAPAPGEVLIRPRAVSLNYRDLLVVQGLYSRKLPLPLTIASDMAGDVIATGSGVTRVKPGDRVMSLFLPAWRDGDLTESAARSALGAFAPGVLAERVLAGEDAVIPVPSHLDYAEASTLPCAALTAWNALYESSRLRPGQTVLVLGSGGVSVFALQLALAGGARVVATTSSPAKGMRLRELGAAEVINYMLAPEWGDQIRRLTGSGVDHIIEIGGAATLNQSVRAARFGATISLIGNRAPGPGEVNLTAALMKALRIQGIFVGSHAMAGNLCAAISRLRLRPVLDRVFPFSQAPEALQYFSAGAHFGKVAISLA